MKPIPIFSGTRALVRSLTLDALSLIDGAPPQRAVRFLAGHSLGGRSPAVFERLLVRLRRRWAFVNFEEAVAMARDGNADGRYLCFSFDDGLAEVYTDIAPCLQRYGVNACVFVLKALLDGVPEEREDIVVRNLRMPSGVEVMSWDNLLALQNAGFVIGCHGSQHHRLGTLSLRTAVEDILNAKVRIEEKLRQRCRFFAWPYGGASDFSRHLAVALAGSFDAMFSTIRSRQVVSAELQCINRHHFEPWWPARHVEHFLVRPQE